MGTATDSGASEYQRIAVRMRGDLVFQRQTYQGQTSWVVKDPVSLRYYRLREELYAALQMLDGRVSLYDVKEELERRFPTVQVKYAELQSLLGRLYRSDLIVADARGQGEQLYQRFKQRQRKQALGQLASILWIRFPGIDPERFLGWLYPKVKWLYSPVCVVTSGALALSALLLVAVQFQVFLNKLPSFHDFFQADNIIWLMLGLAVAKILHELGHGLTCKHFGGECHQIGVLLLVFTPCLYCDTSDAWILPNKWHRAAIGAAGMHVEVVLASICTFVWWYTEPGLLHFLCLNIMLVCSLSTLVFNSNPLLRYDGYYILSDVLEIPNLGQRSRSALIGLLREWCLGLPWNKEATLPPKQRWVFALYALSSVAYRWLVVIGIIWFLSEVLKPYGLQAIAQMFIVTALMGLFVVPLLKTVRFFNVPGRMMQVDRLRLCLTATVVGVALLVFALVPFPHRVITSVTVQPRDAERVYVNVAGQLDALLVKEGQSVAAGQTLAVLKNPEVTYQIARLDGERTRLQQRVQNLRLQQHVPKAAQQIPHSQEMLASLEERLQQLRRDQRRLQLVPGRDGVVFPPPYLPEESHPAGLPSWSHTPLEEYNAGCWLDTGALFCLVGDPQQMEMMLVIDQTDVEFVRPGQEVDIKLDEYPHDTWRGRIDEVARINIPFAHRRTSGEAGGGFSAEIESTSAEQPSGTSYQARISVDNLDGRLMPGLRGKAKINVGKRTAGRAFARFLAETLRLR